MKVLLLTHIYPSTRYPTRGTFNQNIFRAISARCETRLIVPEPWWARVRRPGELFQAPADEYSGIPTMYPTYWSVPRLAALHARGMHRSLRGPVACLRREFPFDIILAAWAYPDAAAAARLAQDWDCPLVTNLLGSDINELTRFRTLRPQIQAALHQSQRIVAVSGALGDKVQELGIPAEKIVVQHNGVDGRLFAIRDRREARRRLGLPPDRRLVGYVGRLSPEKGVDILVGAFGRLQADPDLDLALVGAGAAEASLRAQAATLNISGRVHFAGNQPHATIPDWISAFDVFCLASRREGCPNVVLEALASGRPVVAAHVGGLPELIQGGNGILVTPENPDALAAGLTEALRAPWNEDALRGSVRFLSLESIGAAYAQVLETAVQEWQARTGLRAGAPAASQAPH